jgi:hypothetical protein
MDNQQLALAWVTEVTVKKIPEQEVWWLNRHSPVVPRKNFIDAISSAKFTRRLQRILYFCSTTFSATLHRSNISPPTLFCCWCGTWSSGSRTLELNGQGHSPQVPSNGVALGGGYRAHE